MSTATMIAYFVGALLAFALIKFLIRLPFMIMTIAILGALGYAVYTFVWPMLESVLQ